MVAVAIDGTVHNYPSDRRERERVVAKVMTTPIEERNSLIYAREFLLSLLDPKQTPKVPRKIRKEAGARLRHFPSDWWIKRQYEKLGIKDDKEIPNFEEWK